MATYLLNWNPLKWPWDDLSEMSRETRSGRTVDEPWSTGRSKRILPGDRVFLIRQHVEPRGIMASGRATSGWYEEGHWSADKPKKRAIYVEVEWDLILDPEIDPLLSRERLRSGELGKFYWDVESGVVLIPDDIAKKLE